MSTADSRLDRHLQALFRGLDTRAGFDARLAARLRAESQAEAIERARRARQRERARYVSARSGLRQLTLDTLGMALVLAVVLILAWPQLKPVAIDLLRQHGPYVAILTSLLLAAVPLLGIWADQSRRPLRLL